MFSLSRLSDLFAGIYGFSPGISGLCYIGLGLGFVIATGFGATFADKIYHAVSTLHPYFSTKCTHYISHLKLSQRNGGKGKPEYRIPALIFGSFFVPIGLL